MDIETCVNRIWEIVLDSYGLNVYLRDDEVVVYESLWEKEMKVRIRGLLEGGPIAVLDSAEIGQVARVTAALDTCIAALTKIIEKHGKDWVTREVIFGSEEFDAAMQALKEACAALGYTLKIVQTDKVKN